MKIQQAPFVGSLIKYSHLYCKQFLHLPLGWEDQTQMLSWEGEWHSAEWEVGAFVSSTVYLSCRLLAGVGKQLAFTKITQTAICIDNESVCYSIKLKLHEHSVNLYKEGRGPDSVSRTLQVLDLVLSTAQTRCGSSAYDLSTWGERSRMIRGSRSP